MTSAVFFGLTQPDTLMAQQTQHHCPSDNCTLDTFQSLTICSACNDLTHQLTRVNLRRRDSFCNIVERDLEQDEGHKKINFTLYRLPNGLSLQNKDGTEPIKLMNGFGTDNGSHRISFGSQDTLIWSMILIKVGDLEMF